MPEEEAKLKELENSKGRPDPNGGPDGKPLFFHL